MSEKSLKPESLFKMEWEVSEKVYIILLPVIAKDWLKNHLSVENPKIRREHLLHSCYF